MVPEMGGWEEQEMLILQSTGKVLKDLFVPLKEVPCYVRPGTIIPTSPVVQHSGDIGRFPLEVFIFGGQDGTFALVEDDGWSTRYMQGEFAATSLDWSDGQKTLSWQKSGFAALPRCVPSSLAGPTTSHSLDLLIPPNFRGTIVRTTKTAEMLCFSAEKKVKLQPQYLSSFKAFKALFCPMLPSRALLAAALAAAASVAFVAVTPARLAPRAPPYLTGASTESGFQWQSTTGSHRYVVGAALVAMAASALIVQNKGGGHGEIGYHLALKLAKEKGLKVTMIQDSACKQDKPPFDSYSDLTAAGVDIKMADLQNGGLSAAMQGVQPCEYVFDNQNICPKDVQSMVQPWNPKVYAYVSSGGMYLVPPTGPLIEGGAVKLDNKQLANENHARKLGMNWCAFRPQYIYGPKTNKRDYIDWFLDRITRDLPFPLPQDGSLFTTLTNSEDVAGMMASVVGKEAEATNEATGQIFNCAGDELLSHVDVVKVICEALGKDPRDVLARIVFYDPAALNPGCNKPSCFFEGKFPFRETNFGVAVKKAKEVLGWSPSHTFAGDIAAYYAEYCRLGKDHSEPFGPLGTYGARLHSDPGVLHQRRRDGAKVGDQRLLGSREHQLSSPGQQGGLPIEVKLVCCA
eukprot:s2634_g5.t4